MSDRVQFRRDTKARWEEVNPVLMEGEIGLEIDTNNIKMGDGVHAWNELEYGVGIENITSELGDSENLAASQKLVKVELAKKANAEEVDNSLKELQNTVFPLQVSLSLDKTLLEYTGTEQTVKASYSIKRKDALVMPSSLVLTINGMVK